MTHSALACMLKYVWFSLQLHFLFIVLGTEPSIPKLWYIGLSPCKLHHLGLATLFPELQLLKIKSHHVFIMTSTQNWRRKLACYSDNKCRRGQYTIQVQGVLLQSRYSSALHRRKQLQTCAQFCDTSWWLLSGCEILALLEFILCIIIQTFIT